jgi:cystathionine beta-lyase/cystathionine gamma-synthase
MAAVATLMLAYVRPGETVLHSRPLRGGTEVLIDKTLAPLGVRGVGFRDGLDEQNIRATAEHARVDGRIAMIFIETPSNPMKASPTRQLMEKQSSSAGSTFSFEVKGEQAEAFAFLNRLSGVQISGQPRGNGILNLPYHNDSTFRPHRGSSSGNRYHSVLDSYVDRDRAS